jgi:hypothetical protein
MGSLAADHERISAWWPWGAEQFCWQIIHYSLDWSASCLQWPWPNHSQKSWYSWLEKVVKSIGKAGHNKYHASANGWVLDHQLWIEKRVHLVIYLMLPASIAPTRWMWLYAGWHKCFQAAEHYPRREKCNSIS